ncbi:MAG TPA: type II toxin-antitoxin system PemK/MazF family toxin [Fibrobacteria bacterium]|nr:type II toxin-antitoxin system PemK/MazF family toxin [Fibrobacteria bacterium]
MRPEPREIWLADLGLAAKVRPVVIVSRKDDSPPRDLALYVPCTSQFRGSRYEVALSPSRILDRETWVNAQGIGAIPSPRLVRRLGKVSEADWEKIRTALRFALDLED